MALPFAADACLVASSFEADADDADDAAELADDAAAVFEDSARVSDAFAFVSDVFAAEADLAAAVACSPEIFTQGKYLSPSGVLTTKPHDSAGAHRRACARIADSVCVMGFTAKVC
ncbi:TPA: hypothetical protein J1A83_002791 [Escherichia coli]|nr:hypothetical protein [Escherichia coli]HBA5444410.1 hypothetical protein [Escherichia coli]HBB0924750.1 hypothetical protein [Escherichia coli]